MTEEFDSGFSEMTGSWFTTFTLFHRNTVREVDEFELQDSALEGMNPFTAADLDRVIARADEVNTWISQFGSSSGNPISVIAIVASWPEGDTQNFPRLVTAYWPYWNGPNEPPRDGALELVRRFEASPMQSPILRMVEAADAADQALRMVFPGAQVE